MKFKPGDRVKCINPTNYTGGYMGMKGIVLEKTRGGDPKWIDVWIPGIQGIDRGLGNIKDNETRGMAIEAENWILDPLQSLEEIVIEFLKRQEKKHVSIKESSEDDSSYTG